MKPCFALWALLLAAATGLSAQQPYVAIPDTAAAQTRVRLAATVTPHQRQLAWQRRAVTAFLHFGINTFTDREWGDGRESPALFNPTSFDAHQWMRALSAAGVQLVILTAKHHDGFCLWPSAYTTHSVKYSPWRDGRGDVVKEVGEAARAAGIRFGIYLSPWDRHEPSYGDSPRYNDYFVNQLRELLTNYGAIDEVWFDGAKGEGVPQVHDWPRYYRTVRELQPQAVIAVKGPDVRWVGTESGYGRETEWSVVATDSADDALARAGVWLPIVNEQAPDLGSREQLAHARALFWYPAEVDVSIRPGWFYHAAEDARVKSVQSLVDIYYASVGRNAALLLNVPPDRRGLIADPDVRSLRGFGDALRATFTHNLARGAGGTLTDGNDETYWRAPRGDSIVTITLDLKQPRRFGVLLLQEHIRTGQRVEEFAFDVRERGRWRTIARGTTIGYKRLLRFAPVRAREVRLRITRSRLEPAIAEIGLYQ